MEGVVLIKAGIITVDPALSSQLKRDLEQSGFISVTNGHGNGGQVDVVLLDCRDSQHVVERIENLKDDAPVLAIVKEKPDLPVEIFTEFTDVLFYPYTEEELYFRLSLAAYKSERAEQDEIFEWGGFRINYTNYEVSVDGNKLDLTYKEYELLKHMASAPGRVFTRSQLLKSVWGYDYIEGARTVDVHIRRLRSKLGSKYANLIETVRHVGYRFKPVSSNK
ncbi:MAG: winged helix-turn-helix transcriptional regulator [Candidatus Aquicultor sp.]